MESSSLPSMSKKLWHIVRVVYYMLRKSISKQKLLMDLHLLLKRSKIGSRNHDHHHANDIATVVSSELEFSSTTKAKNRRGYHLHNAEAIATVLEILHSQLPEGEPVAASPSLAPAWSVGKSPVSVRQLRVTDSPFPVRDGAGESGIDKEAEAFIRRFYAQLSLQPTATPDHTKL